MATTTKKKSNPMTLDAFLKRQTKKIRIFYNGERYQLDVGEESQGDFMDFELRSLTAKEEQEAQRITNTVPLPPKKAIPGTAAAGKPAELQDDYADPGWQKTTEEARLVKYQFMLSKGIVSPSTEWSLEDIRDKVPSALTGILVSEITLLTNGSESQAVF